MSCNDIYKISVMSLLLVISKELVLLLSLQLSLIKIQEGCSGTLYLEDFGRMPFYKPCANSS